MEVEFLYRQISETIRQQILRGELKPGDRLPSVREMTLRWKCTLGTIQRAYQELSRQGLVTSRAGRGTHVLDRPAFQREETPLRRAALIHRAEAFLLEVLTAGYLPTDVEDAVRQALDRWRTVAQQTAALPGNALRFTGSHDLVVAWLATHFSEIATGYTLQLSFVGSLGGLIALAEGQADIAGCHLWDEESNTYNDAFVRRLLPGKPVTLIALAHRQIGLITTPGNPAGIQGLPDLLRAELRFINRQSGSGTRVWLDAQLRKLGISPKLIQGYTEEKMTHSELARAIAEGSADVGLGLEAAASVYGLGFVPLTQERYDLAIPTAKMTHPAVQALVKWIDSSEAAPIITSFAGYTVPAISKVDS